MCRLRAAVCGGVGVTTGRDIQPSLRPQREVHAVSDKHKPENGNPGMEICCPRCVKKMTPTCVSLSLPKGVDVADYVDPLHDKAIVASHDCGGVVS